MRSSYVVLCVTAGLASSAAASTISLKYHSLSHGTAGTHQVTIHAAPDILPGTSTSMRTYAGPLNHQTGAATGKLSSLANSIITTFCTELSQVVTKSAKTYKMIPVSQAPKPLPVGGMGEIKAEAIRLLWAAVGNDKFTSPLLGAAFQIAIWEIVYDGPESFDLTTGDIRFTNATVEDGKNAIAKAQWLFDTYVWDNGNLRSGPIQAGLVALSSDFGQDQLIVIPLPAQGVMALAGLLGIGTIRRRRA